MPAADTKPKMNETAIWAFVLSIIGITFPIGLFLGLRAQGQIQRSRPQQFGGPFAKVAVVVGLVYLVVFALGLLLLLYLRL